MKTRFTVLKCFLSIAFLTSLNALGSNPVMLAPPVNDLIENAIDLSQVPTLFTHSNVNFPEATTPGDGGQQGCTTGVAGIWYKFTPTAAGDIGAGLANDNGPIIVFYSSPNPNATSGQELTHVDQVSNPCDNGNFALISASVGVHYYIYVKNNVISDVLINSEEVFAPPLNDFVSNATDLNGLEDYFDEDVHFMVATGIDDAGQTGCDTQGVIAVWYKFTAAIEGQVVAGIDLNAGIGGVVFYSAVDENATSGSDLTWVDQPGNGCDTNSIASIIASPGTTYYLMAGVAPNVPMASVSVNLAGILGTGEQTIEGFSFYPNPVSDIIQLKAISNIETVELFNLSGQRLLSENINSTAHSIDFSSLRTGNYIMTVVSEGKKGSYKIVKQ